MNPRYQLFPPPSVTMQIGKPLSRSTGIKPDAIVFNSLLDGCAKKELPMLCEQAPKRGREDIGVYESMAGRIVVKIGRILNILFF